MNMVYICNDPYKNMNMHDIFAKYTFELSDFQKYAIEHIVQGNHVLLTAHTGSGKTLPAEFAIEYFVEKGKKVVYTSPIKALSNQKYYEFTQKYPHISFGIFTGDIKINANADVLIMTTEILKNYLFLCKHDVKYDESIQNNFDFQLNINEELGCVIYDEVHYINDAERGQNWEQSILMLPDQIQMVMLSATIDSPDKFASWCESTGTKKVALCSTNHRVVPLTHYGFITTHEGIFKKIKDKEVQQKLRDKTNKFITLRTSNGKFEESGYENLKSTLQYYDKNNIFINKTHVLNQLSFLLKEQEMLPAIAFVFSRKMVEIYAKSITTNILEFDSKIPYTMRNECDQMLRKLPNYKEYINLPEYDNLVKLLEKGIGIHHSGMIPILREIVEKMISKGCIKLLFATESFAIGLDCPIRTAIFTSLTKFDGNKMRYLMPHEYSQAAGRAGRRGLDTIGHVIHCNNMFEFPCNNEYREILCGNPQILESKFYISFNVILSLLKNGKTTCKEFEEFVSKSMLQEEIVKAIENEKLNNEHLCKELQSHETYCENLRTCKENIMCYKTLLKESSTVDGIFRKMSNKQKKEQERQLESLKMNNKFLLQDYEEIMKLETLEKQCKTSGEHISYYENFVKNHVFNACEFLLYRKIIEKKEDYELTSLGHICSNINEVNSIVMGEFLKISNFFDDFSCTQIIGFMSLFCDVRVNEDIRSSIAHTDDFLLKMKIEELCSILSNIEQLEINYHVHSGSNYEIVYDMIGPMMEWATLETEQQCKYFIQTKLNELGVSLGDFTKGLLKVNNICKEITNICYMMNQSDQYKKFTLIEEHLMKFIVTNQSLYI